MNANKLLSAMIIAVMVASVCTVPFAAAEEPAAEEEFVLKEGDSYGLLINVSKADIYNIANEVIGSETIDDDYVKEYIETLLKKEAEDAKNISIDFDIIAKAGIAASIVEITDDTNTYRFTGVVDATAMFNGSYDVAIERYIEIPPGKEDDISAYIKDNVDLIKEGKTVTVEYKNNLSCGLSIDASISVDNESGALKSIDAKIGLYFNMKTERSDFEWNSASGERIAAIMTENNEVCGNAYIDVHSFENGDITMIQSNGIKCGFGDDNGMFFEVDERGDVKTHLTADAVKDALSGVASITEIDDTMIEDIGKIINEKDEIISKLPDIIKIKDKETGNEELNVNLIKSYLTAINKVFGFVFGEDGLALTDNEVNSIRQSASDVLNKSKSEIASKEFTVEFYPDLKSVEDPAKAVKKTVKFGDSVVITDDIKGYMNAPNKVFIGWFAYTYDDGEWEIEFEGPNAIGMVTCDMKLVPVFADKKTSIEEIYMEDDIADEMFAIVSGSASFNAAKLAGKDNVHIEVGNDDDAVGSIVWNFKGNNTGATGEVQLGYSAKKDGSVVTIDFEHSKDLPVGTSVTIDMGSSFDAGTVLKVYHIHEEGGESFKELITGTAIVGVDGKVTIPIASCSSYIFEANDVFSSIVNTNDDGGSDGGINLLLVGGGIAAVAVIGVGAFLFMRRQ